MHMNQVHGNCIKGRVNLGYDNNFCIYFISVQLLDFLFNFVIILM